MRRIMLIFCLVLLICQPGAANPVMISGVGQVELGQDIIVTEGHDKNGDIKYSFRVKDGAVWRGAVLLPINILPSKGSDFIKTDVLLNRILEEKASKDKNTLSIEKARRVMVGGRECATTTVKFDIPDGGIIYNLDITIIPETDGLKMVSFMCTDSDAQFWRPILQKILNSIS